MIVDQISRDLSLKRLSVAAVIGLLESDATIPFIARYRKEQTAGLNETELRQIQMRYQYYSELEDRKSTILRSIQVLNKLSPELKTSIDRCMDKQLLEDLYLPYKTKRKTKADVAIANGYLPVAQAIMKQQSYPCLSQDALAGATDIIAQWISDSSVYRQTVRQCVMRTGQLKTKRVSRDHAIKTKFDMYSDFSERLASAASHRLLAIRRGERENIIRWTVDIDHDAMLLDLEGLIIKQPQGLHVAALKHAIRDAYKRLIYPSVQNECFKYYCDRAESDSIVTFSQNLKMLLMAPPAGAVVIMGIDPGFRSGCKLAIVDRTGQFQRSKTIYPIQPHLNHAESERIVLDLLSTYSVELIAIGNGTGSKETVAFIRQLISDHQLSVIPVVVSEAGASVYSASELAIQEYPDLDVTIRGAISIAHRLQDPLAALVKIDPKSIGVGQYQHDVNQRQLKEALTYTISSVVNAIGIDVNTASWSLLAYVSGIGVNMAQHIVAYREKHGPFTTRHSLLKVPKLGPKVFEQCAGFLRVRQGVNQLDATAVHPESYELAEALLSCGCDLEQIDLLSFVTETVGLPTLRDIQSELLKPSRDPRAEFQYATFDDEIDDIADLQSGMILEGVVTNVTNFGAFVDIGVHQDGLIHISKLSTQFVKNPHDIVAVGDRVRVSVLDVDRELNRIQLAKQ